MPPLELSFQGRDEMFSVRHFRVQMGMSSLFTVSIMARSEHDDVDLDAITGTAAALRVTMPTSAGASAGSMQWSGVCSHIEQVAVESGGLSTYHVTIVP